MAELRGVVARIEWTYYTAAAINGYTVRRDKATNTWSAVVMVVDLDAFKLAQRPLFLVAPYQGGSWRWPILSGVKPERGRLALTLGAPCEVGNKPHVMVR